MLLFARLLLLCDLACAFAFAQTANPRVSFSRILPGGGVDVAVRTLVEPGGDVWVGGHSYGKYEAYGPNEPFQSLNKGASDIFLVKFRPFPDGTAQVLFFTWIGGGGIEELFDMKFDDFGRIVIAGTTASNDWPIAGNAAQTTFGGDIDTFVAVVDPNAGGAASLFYSTYYGGTGREFARALAVSPTGRVAVAGQTAGEDAPFMTGGAQPNKRGGVDIFLFTINSTAAGGFSYATYLGGNGTDTCTSILWDNDDTLWFTGNTGSSDFPATDNAYQRASSGFFDAYLVHIDPKVSGLAGYLYASYLGGQGNDEGRALVRLADGTFFLSGLTFSRDYPLYGEPLQTTLAGASDLFLTRIDPRLAPENQILYSGYFGGTGTDIPYAMTITSNNLLAIAGYSMSGLLPTTENALSRRPASAFADGALFLFNIEATNRLSLNYSTYFGGSSTDLINSVAFDPLNPRSLVFAGTTTSADFLTTDGSIRPNPNPSPSAFLTRLER